jgi:hypothetical protein
MLRQGRWRRVLVLCLVALGLASSSGCMSGLHAVDPAKWELINQCQAGPPGTRDHVHIFFVHGIEMVDVANLHGVQQYCHSLGFYHTYVGEMYHTGRFINDIRAIHQSDPEARFVLVGFSFGANKVRNIARAVKDDGICIDLLIYLGGNTLHNTPEDQPENAARIINILATGWIWNGDTMERAENIHVDGVWHFGSPTHPRTLEVLASELAAVVAQEPVTQPVNVMRHPPAAAH